MKTKRRYTWKPDLPDHRDYGFRMKPTAAVPAHVDLRPSMPPVFDQGQLGSCTGNAIAAAIGFIDGPAAPPASRLFIYYQERVIERDVKQDNGAQIRDGVKACAAVGTCNEKTWPYIISKFATKPSKAAYAEAATDKITAYARVGDLSQLKNALAMGFPVVFGFSVYESFESAEVAKTGTVPMPFLHEKLLGGHAVLCVGYDDAVQRVLVRNSWGEKWGMAGYFTMPYAYVSDRNLSDDFWVIRK